MKTFTQWIMEGRSFMFGGKKYSSGFGRYTCDGESISKEEYQKASAAYKGDGTVKSSKTKEPKVVDKEQKKIPSVVSSLSKFDKIHTNCGTYQLLKNTVYKPVKSLKECEEQISKFTNKKVYLSGITNKEVYNGIGESIHKVFSKYPYLGESNELRYFATQAGMNKSVEDDVEEYMNSEEAEKSIQADLDWVVKKYKFAEKGSYASKAMYYMVGTTKLERKKFQEKHGITYDTVIDDKLEKAFKEFYLEARRKIKKKNYKDSIMPSEFKAKNAFAFYVNTDNKKSSWKKWTGVYFSPTNMKKSVDVYDKMVELGESPKGTTHASIVTHEIGHALDMILNLKDDEEIRELYRNNDVRNGVSKYAGSHIKEFIAEAFSEYIHSPSPRPLAEKVGKIIDKKYELYAMAMEVVGDMVKKGDIPAEQVDMYRDAVLSNVKSKLGGK